MPSSFLGIDIGTSGIRAVVIDRKGSIKGSSAYGFSDQRRHYPENWLDGVRHVLSGLHTQVRIDRINALAVDGTSGTMLAVWPNGNPAGPPRMYNEVISDPKIIDRLMRNSQDLLAMPSLPRAVALSIDYPHAQLVHQADWIAGMFLGRFNCSDANNALKTGYDIQLGSWSAAVKNSGLNTSLLPIVYPAGTALGKAEGMLAREYGIQPSTVIVAGTTDGCASFLGTGAKKPGDAVSAIGSTLTLKVLSDRRIEDPGSGVYSHLINGMWLTGGASNTGGSVLLKYFNTDRLNTLSKCIDPSVDCGLDYYPLTEPGERFPINDPLLPPKVTPRPQDDALFLHGLLQGIAKVEALGYNRLTALGAPKPSKVLSVGGGSENATWREIRSRILGIPVLLARNADAALGTAFLARTGWLSS